MGTGAEGLHNQQTVMNFAQAVENSTYEGINNLAIFFNRYDDELDGWMGNDAIAAYRQNYYQLINQAQSI